MKRWLLAGISVLAMAIYLGALPGSSWSGGRGQGFRPCPYSPYECPVQGTCKPFDEAGKVVQVLTETLSEGMHPGMALVLETKNRGQVLVHLAPVWYLERQEFVLTPGDEVRVKGRCEKEKDGRLGVVAFAVTKGDYLLHLRDDLGRPNWEAWRKR